MGIICKLVASTGSATGMTKNYKKGKMMLPEPVEGSRSASTGSATEKAKKRRSLGSAFFNVSRETFGL